MKKYFIALLLTFFIAPIVFGQNNIESNGVMQKNEIQRLTIKGMEERATQIHGESFKAILTKLDESRNLEKEMSVVRKHLKNLKRNTSLSKSTEEFIINFITYGVDEQTKFIGEGERAAVLYSYKTAYRHLPETDDEISDTIKISNGRFPKLRNRDSELRAKKVFQNIYERVPNPENGHDKAAVYILAYGLKQAAENRNLDSERAGIGIFRRIYNKNPEITEEWNMVQAIAYSGAERKVDSDGDGLADVDEKSLGSDPKKIDSDGDGFYDGMEVLNRFSPKNPQPIKVYDL